jgi:hypothetical protein
MVQAMSGEVAKRGRVKSFVMGGRRREGRVQYIGGRVTQVAEGPQAYLVEMEPDTVIEPHFHQVDQFQIMVSGSGTLGRNKLGPIAIHYADHSTAYGPINAGTYGLSFFTIRSRSDPSGIYLADPEHKKLLRPTRKRYFLSDAVLLSTETALESRSERAVENLMIDMDCSDGLGANMLRMGAGMKTTSADPRTTGGLYYLVVNGALELDGARYEPWSVVHATAADAPLAITAGSGGLEAVVLHFPRATA